MALSGGTFSLKTETVTENDSLVTTTVRFTAQREGVVDLDQHGVDMFRVEVDRIAEIWLISENQTVEDQLWAAHCGLIDANRATGRSRRRRRRFKRQSGLAVE